MNDKTPPIRVLLIEDHVLFREALRIAIETEAGFQVVGDIDSLERGIAILRESAIDVAVVDLRMFQQTGTFILGTLKRDNAKLRIVALSPGNESDMALEALRSGAHGIVDIKAGSATLRDTIRSVARGSIVLDAAIAPRLIAPAPNRGSSIGGVSLGTRDLQLLRLIAASKSSKQIAALLGLTLATIGTYRKTLMKKLALENVAQVTSFALHHGLASRDDRSPLP